MKQRNVLAAGLAAVLFTAGLHIFPPQVLQSVSAQVHDVLVRRLARPPQSDAILIVDVDDQSLSEVGQWPWPRARHARLLQQLWSQGARVVAFDMLFTETDQSSPERVAALWSEFAATPIRLAGLPDGLDSFDRQFATALRQGASVLGAFVLSGEDYVPDPLDRSGTGGFYELGIPARHFLAGGESLLLPLEVLRGSGGTVGALNTIADPDHIIRRTPLVFACEPDQLVGSLALEAVRHYLDAGALGLFYDRETALGLKAIRAGSRTTPTDLNGRVVLNYRNKPFPTLSASDVLAGRFNGADVANRIVFVGASAAGLNDLVTTPMGSSFPGVEVHATAADNLLAGDVLLEPPGFYYVQLAAVMLTGLLATLLVGWLGPLRSLLAVLGLAIGVLAFASWALWSQHWVVSPMLVLLSVSLAYTASTVVRYDQERRGRQRVRSMFSTMVSDTVLRYMEERPDSFSLVGRRTNVTVAFSDLADFTTFSERMDPVRLTEMLNRYLTPMTEIILARNGYVNKYNGDAIMSVWNVPLDVPNHAVQACLASLEQYECLARLQAPLREEFGCDLRMRMGINTGEVTAGNMGSKRRFEYTVMGDIVNAASRFESAGKMYGVERVMGEGTFLAARDHIEARKLDRLVVKGKSQPVWIYELLARRGELTPERVRVVQLYEDAFIQHLQRAWDEADALLLKALSLDGADGPCAMLLKRIATYRENPPPPDWDGAFLLTSK